MNYILSLFLTLILFAAKAQVPENYIGLRLGRVDGLSFTHHTDKLYMYNGILGFKNNGIQLYGNVGVARDVKDLSFGYLNTYFGAGAHMGYMRSLRRIELSEGLYDYRDPQPYYFQPVGGINALAGLELVLYKFPIAIGIETMPTFTVIGFNRADFDLWETALHIKWYFN